MGEKWHGGKGSKARKVDQKAYNENWERIFGKKQQQQEPETDKKKEQAEERVHNQ